MQNIIIIGGGIAGLSSAYFLNQAGHHVTLLESSQQLGGLGTFFEHEGKTFERFYHCMLPSDDALLGLLRELGLERDIVWKNTTFGFWRDGQLFRLNSALDLIRFTALSFLSRLRIGLTALIGRWHNGNGLDDIGALRWLTFWSGKEAGKIFWRPLLEAKFGDACEEIPALWFWQRFQREKKTGTESKGYLRGGYHRLIQVLESTLLERGVEIVKSCSVQAINVHTSSVAVETSFGVRNADAVLSTCAPPVMRQLLQSSPSALDRIPEIEYQGVVNVVLMVKTPRSVHYWIATPDASIPFQGVVDTSLLFAENELANDHVMYFMNYCHRNSAAFQADEAKLIDAAKRSLLTLFPHLGASDITASYVFRAPFVEPLYPLGYATRKPKFEIAPGQVFWASTAHVYPDVTSWNAAVQFAKENMPTITKEKACAPSV